MSTNPHNRGSYSTDPVDVTPVDGSSMGVNIGKLTETKRQVVEVSRLAGAKILELFLPEIAVTHKDDETPLTAADLAANKLIIDQLRIIAPALPVITEESCAVPHTERRAWPTYWLVDPLDGTREFIKQHGEFSVNIALIHNGRPVLGVVHAPILLSLIHI